MRTTAKRIFLSFAVAHILVYYAWLYLFQENDRLLTVGGDLISFSAAWVVTLVLYLVQNRHQGMEKRFWQLIMLGTFSYSIAEGIWTYTEIVKAVIPSFPGWPDFFYMLQVVFYLAAFFYKTWRVSDLMQCCKISFDAAIIMTVAISFSWHFIIRDIVGDESSSALFLFVSIGYPVGDLVLLFIAMRSFFGSEHLFSRNVLYITMLSLLVQVFADSAYLYLEGSNLYLSGSLFDPLWTMALYLMGFAGLASLDFVRIRENLEDRTARRFFLTRLWLPYASVILLFSVMLSQKQGMDSLSIGASIAILLVVSRQVLTLLENQNLLDKYHQLTERLEQRITERTDELSRKNHQLTTVVKKMRHMAYHDVLSDLPNRRFFLERLTEEMGEARRRQGLVAILFVDLDRFKNINDTLGHEFGDEVLRHVSKQMVQSLRKEDTISRQGGDEFAVLLGGLSSEEEILSLIARLQGVVAEPFTLREHEIHLSMSIGVALYPQDGESTEALMKHADMAMYKAKESGGNSHAFFSHDLNESYSRRMKLENGLRKAITNGEFVLHYQPQVDILTGEIVGLEALIRWETAEGMVSPAEFIPLAEETRLIIPIGEFVLRSACMEGKRWHTNGHDHLKIAVNLSPLQFMHTELLQTIAIILDETGFDPASLEIEITEGVAVLDAEASIEKMEALRALGIHIALDDFGTGYSSLHHLKHFPINHLKIAQPFVRDLTMSLKDRSIVQTIIHLGHGLGLSVIAEGVETLEQREILRALGCDEIQGYFYSRPLPVAQFDRMLEESSRLGS
ncbi:putative bifunctional diguanylate cyclase/phosphodiesterase [Exiguobacterium flavidum]|uniref:putative bifunctional diguanylate cyclase/phosphodiesterase n=1 Tax=Exiguobacterium flavidum TaxID=2184695 RepID=UPI000DF7CA34|nr:DUF4084 domain-containing protein [Exiguobacterium flavidum]